MLPSHFLLAFKTKLVKQSNKTIIKPIKANQINQIKSMIIERQF